MKSKYSLLIALGVMLFASCHRRPLDEGCVTDTKIPIGTVWEKSEVDAQNVTAYFYDASSGKLVREHRFENSPREIQSYVPLPFGDYTVVVHNEIREQIKNVSVRGFENLSTLELYSQIDPEVKQTRDEGDTYVRQPDPIAAATIRNVSVKPNVENKQLIGIETEQKNSYMYITVHVKGINNARMPALVDLRNIASGYFINDDKPSDIHSTIQFTMNNRTYDEGSETAGTISTVLALHGTLSDRMSVDGHKEKPLILDMLFMLVDKDKTVVRRSVDITKLLSFTKIKNGSVHLTVQLDLEESLPDVQPDGGSGMGSDIIDWEGEQVDIIL